jgi:pimeloyl-ACP methyl ester carboxylesterase
VDALGLGRFHLVVHDIGGPAGFELAAAMPARIASLTVLNTLIEVDTFKRPWSMEPFARRGIGQLYLRTLTKPTFRLLMRRQGVQDPHRFEAMRAHLLEQAGDPTAARDCCLRAAKTTGSVPEQRYLELRAARLHHRTCLPTREAD